MMLAANQPRWLGKLVSLVIGAVLLLLGFMFSLVVLAVVAILVLLALGYFWWKTRTLRKAMRQYRREPSAGGQVIDGEATIIKEYRTMTNPLPGITTARR